VPNYAPGASQFKIALAMVMPGASRDPAPFLAFRRGRMAGGANGVPQLPSPPVAESVVIRAERDADQPVIAEVVRAAFAGHPDEVASLVERIRGSEQFIPELALVAEDSSGVIAHVMLSWVGVEGGSRTRILNLTPMSVRPDRQRIGVGARLIRDALGRAEEAGQPAVMVEGIPAYYPRFGFEQASALGFISPHPRIPDDAFMVKRLPGYSPDLASRIVYPPAFDALGY
jgi:putative acetyltransferase